VTTASIAALVGLFVFGFTTLEISASRILQGFGRLGEFVALMLPPSFGTLERLQIFRAVDVLIWALIWINVVGLGPFAGILPLRRRISALSVVSCSRRPLRPLTIRRSKESFRQAVVFDAVRFGIVPQVSPVFIS
jgi:phosphonate transport system permease protein